MNDTQTTIQRAEFFLNSGKQKEAEAENLQEIASKFFRNFYSAIDPLLKNIAEQEGIPIRTYSGDKFVIVEISNPDDKDILSLAFSNSGIPDLWVTFIKARK